ncbi:hypothetical protein [Paenibacillus ihbetae]|uniref:hypothetical protein n=1 Tax=Paenibacillus ihbetae TaxID=1870820 RepID=UPI001F3D0F9D|nr:hypothetical protein [Paenibacillus ihbetae]
MHILNTEMNPLDGLNEEKLQEIRDNASKLSEMQQEVPVEDVFTDAFVQRHTGFSSIGELLKSAGYQGTTDEDFDRFIQHSSISRFMAEHTPFDSWQAFQDQAVTAYITRLLGL